VFDIHHNVPHEFRQGGDMDGFCETPHVGQFM
jgi:hypothetical protein